MRRPGTTAYSKHKNTHFLNHDRTIIGEKGLSIHRKIDPRQLDSVMNAFRQFRVDLTTSTTRGEGTQYHSALSQLEVNETKRQTPLHDISLETARDTVYDSVRSIRRPMTSVRIGRAILIGRKNPLVSVALAFHPEDAEMMHQERADIIDSLEALSDDIYTSEDFTWSNRGIPHVSVGKIPRSTPQPHIDQMLSAIEQAAPITLRIDRASIH